MVKKFQSSYNLPPAPYKPGQKITIAGETYKVAASTHTHTQLEGFNYAVANWVIAQMKKSPFGEEFALIRENTDPLFQASPYHEKLAPTPSAHNLSKDEVRFP